MIHVRSALASDADAISALSAEVQAHHAHALPQLFKPAAPNTFPPAAVRELLKDRDRIVLVACTDILVVGYASAQIQQRAETPFRHAQSALCIQWMGVHAEWRRKGVGLALVHALRDEAERHRLAVLVLDVWSFNADARAFYEAAGFHPQRHILSLELDGA
jgi:ribosomal protein S18 acetylase RimI-like enzyme